MIFKIKQNFYLIISTTYYATSIKNTQKVCVRSSLPEATTIHRRISQEHQKHFLQAWFQLALWLMGKRFNFGESRFGTPSSGIPCLPRPPSISPSCSHRRNSIPERTVPEKPNDWMGWIYLALSDTSALDVSRRTKLMHIECYHMGDLEFHFQCNLKKILSYVEDFLLFFFAKRQKSVHLPNSEAQLSQT